MEKKKLKIAFYGSSIVSAYWNGAATYYRGIIKALYNKGHQVTFFEPDAYERQKHRDIEDPEYARVVIYDADEKSTMAAIRQCKNYDIIVKASGVGVNDELLEQRLLEQKQPHQTIIFWDVDAPATLSRMNENENDSFRRILPEYDLVLTYGGGDPVVKAYEKLGAKECIPIYNALDPDTHHPAVPNKKFESHLAFLGNRLPDREARVEEFFIKAASLMPDKKFILGGSGWGDKNMPANIDYFGHVYTKDHNSFNCTPHAVLNISRESMAHTGFSPATRVFEAAGAGACLITDAWKGIELFLEPDKEVLVAKNGEEVADILAELDPERGSKIGNAALKRVLAEHTYADRAEQLEKILSQYISIPKKAIA